MRRWVSAWAVSLASATLLATPLPAQRRAAPAPHWIATWGTSQMIPGGENVLPAEHASNVTVRQIVRISAGGSQVRVRFSNAFGTRALTLGAAHLALAARAGTPRLGSGVPLTFGGRADAVIPMGAEVYSDPVTLPLAPGADVAISLFLPDAAQPQTSHPGARATSFVADGNHVADPDLPGAWPTTRWYHIADIEVAAPPAAGTVVAIGDSITDGYGVKPERNTRWTDVFAARLRASAATRGIGVVNAGIGGNRVLADGLGPNLLARFDRDVIARSGVRWAILLEGVNDIGGLTRSPTATPELHRQTAEQVIAGMKQVVARAHAHGIRIVGGTVTPFGGNGYSSPEAEAGRQAVNAFIRAPGSFDAVVDFDRVTRDPAHPDRLAPALDSGDHLHPSEAGYKAMGEAIPLSLFGARGPVAGAVAPVPVVPAPPAKPAIAFTFDDIPAHGALPPGETRLSVIRRITDALAVARVPAFGFLNAGFGLDDPTHAQAIAAWTAAGLPLGNHGYSHLNLAQVGAPAFAADIVRNEAPLAAAAHGRDWHWLRYPFLSEGTDPATRDAARADLKARGYKIAAVTMSFADYNWAEPYAACTARRDAAAVARLENGFLADARTAALAARAKARGQVGRDIPYVLLMHVGAMTAHMLPRLVALYRELGFDFTTLAAAEADPYYRAATDLSLPGPTPSLAGPPASALAGPPAGLCA